MASVIMFHSVGLRCHSWMGQPIAEDVSTFESKVHLLHRAGYRSVKFTDPELRANTASRLTSLTFDDGYLDNWVHVFPVLQHYGMSATILVTPEFVDPRDVKRPLVEPGSVDDETHDAASCCAGFLSWPEMRAMVDSGLVEIQSHALTHTWYESGPRIIDYWHPGSATEVGGPVWMLWNRFPEFKPFYLTEAAAYETRIPYGTPVYEHGKALVTRRYFPEEGDLIGELHDHVTNEGGRAFFQRASWREELDTIVRRFRSQSGGTPRGRMETEDEYRARVRHELRESRRILAERLQMAVDGLAWPGGGASPEVLEMAVQAGYRTFTTPLSLDGVALDEAQGTLIRRVGSGGRVRWRTRDLGVVSGPTFLWYLQSQEGSARAKWLFRSAKLVRLARSLLQ